MRKYLEPVHGVNDLTDSVEKIAPAVIGAARAVASSPAGRKAVGAVASMGVDAIKNKLETKKYDIRFHMEPGVKLTKTLDNKTILIEIENSGWKFSTNCEIINIESGIYFGNKNLTSENQNICLSGKIKDITQEIKWVFEKIQ